MKIFITYSLNSEYKIIVDPYGTILLSLKICVKYTSKHPKMSTMKLVKKSVIKYISFLEKHEKNRKKKN